MGLFGNFLILVDRGRLRGLGVGKATMVLQALQLRDSPQASPDLSTSSCFGLVPDIIVPFCNKPGRGENQQQSYCEFVGGEALW